MKTTLYLLATLFLSECQFGERTYKFNIRNGTNDTIQYYRAHSEDYFHYVYPDTTIIEEKFDLSSPSGRIRPKMTLQLGGFSPVENVFKTYKNDTLSIFFFNRDTLRKYPWETIRKDYNILKRYDLSIQDIQLLDYEISYPPNEAMKEMKMYPPYEE